MAIETKVMAVTAAMAASDERILYPLVADFVAGRGFSPVTEVMYHGRKPYEIDVVGVRGHQILAVEVKLRYFSKAFRQAMKRLRHSDYVYMGFPMQYAAFAAQEYRKTINKFGFGIIGIDENRSVEIVPPKHSKQLNNTLKERFIRDVKKQGEMRRSMEAEDELADAE